jgi:uncharacterized protein YajQ (UPF0234 family)
MAGGQSQADEAKIPNTRRSRRKKALTFFAGKNEPPHFGCYEVMNCHFSFPTVALTFLMPSFDIVSQVNSMEIENAVNQAQKELANRFDFKGTKAEIILEKDEIKLTAENQFKITALAEIMVGKLAKRSISLKNVERGEPDISPLGHARQSIKIKQGLEQPVAKEITGFIRESKFKVTTQIQGNEVRVTAKSRDELQEVIAAMRAREFPVAVQFVNFRD